MSSPIKAFIAGSLFFFAWAGLALGKAEPAEREAAPPVTDYPGYAETIRAYRQLPGETAAHQRAGASLAKSSLHTWEPIGAGVLRGQNSWHRNGRAQTLAFAYDHSQGAETLYLGAMGGGLWKWRVAQQDWERLSLELEGAPSVGDFLVDPDDSKHLLMGTGEVRFRGTGLYRTTDEGASWAAVALPGTQPDVSYRLAYDRTDAKFMLYGNNRGLYVSTDRGETWQSLVTDPVADVEQHPSSPDLWYVGVSGSGVSSYSRSQNQLTPLSPLPGIQANKIERILLTTCPAAPQWVFALAIGRVMNDGNGESTDVMGIFRSDDGGESWVDIARTDGTPSWGQAWHTGAFIVHPQNPDLLYLGLGGFEWSADATAARPRWIIGDAVGHDDYTRFTFDNSGDHLWVTNDGGVYSAQVQGLVGDDSRNLAGGLNLQQLVAPYGAFDSADNFALAGLQDNGTVRIDHASGIIESLTGGDGGSVSIFDDQTFSGSIGLAFTRRLSQDGGQSWPGIDCGFSSRSEPQQVIIKEYQGTKYLFTHEQQHVYYQELGAGCPWYEVNADPFPNNFTAIKLEIAQDAQGELTFYVSGYGLALLVMDTATQGSLGQMSWEDRTPSMVPTNATQMVIYADKSTDPVRSREVFYTTAGSPTPGIFFGANAGEPDASQQSWHDLTGNLAQLVPGIKVFEVVRDPRNLPNTFFLASSVGVLRTDDAGASWYRWSEGLARVIDVRSIEVRTLDATLGIYELLIGTNGSGFWARRLRKGHDDFLPSVAMVYPSEDAMSPVWVTSTGSIQVWAEAQDQTGIREVHFWAYFRDAQGVLQELDLGADTSPNPVDGRYSRIFDVATVPDQADRSFPFDLRIEAEAVDVDGNHSSRGVGWILGFDRRPPAVGFASPATDLHLSGGVVALAVTTSDTMHPAGLATSLRVTARYRGVGEPAPSEHTLATLTNAAGWSGSIDLGPLPEQTVLITARADDEAGNWASAARTLYLDRTAPQITFDGQSPSPFITNGTRTASISYHLSEPVAQVSLTISDTAGQVVRQLVRVGAGTQPLVEVWDGRDRFGNLLPSGSYGFGFQAIDGAGNLGQQSGGTIDLVVDLTPPAITLDFAAEFTLRDDPLKIVYSHDEDARAEIEIFDLAGTMVNYLGAWQNPAGEYPVPWTGEDFGGNANPGDYVIVLRVTDLAGNVSTAQGTVTASP